MIPDEKRRTDVVKWLYNGDSLIGDGDVFTNMLQAKVIAAYQTRLRRQFP